MRIAAEMAIKQAYAVLGMDASPARLRWMRKLNGEAGRALLKRRRAWLLEAGSGLHLCSYHWDDLPKVARDKLVAVS